MQIVQRPVRLRGNSVARAVLRMAGWRVGFDGLPQRQGVVIVYPHTSNWDFLVGILAKWSIGIPVAFWGKASLFRVPLFGRWLRWLGGIAVDRAHPSGVVRDSIERLRLAIERDEFLWLALAPEGTRKYSDSWRSGFWHVAVGAGVPLGLAYFDFARRIVSLERFIRLTGDVEHDMHEIARYLAHRVGFNARQAAPVRLREVD